MKKVWQRWGRLRDEGLVLGWVLGWLRGAWVGFKVDGGMFNSCCVVDKMLILLIVCFSCILLWV